MRQAGAGRAQRRRVSARLSCRLNRGDGGRQPRRYNFRLQCVRRFPGNTWSVGAAPFWMTNTRHRAADGCCCPDTLAKQRNTLAKEQNTTIKINRECRHSSPATLRPHLRMHTGRHFVFCIPALRVEKCQTASQPATPPPPTASQKGNAPAANKLGKSAQCVAAIPAHQQPRDGVPG